MTKKDYMRAAEIVRALFVTSPAASAAAEAAFLTFFADAPKFDRERFKKACQPIVTALVKARGRCHPLCLCRTCRPTREA